MYSQSFMQSQQIAGCDVLRKGLRTRLMTTKDDEMPHQNMPPSILCIVGEGPRLIGKVGSAGLGADINA